MNEVDKQEWREFQVFEKPVTLGNFKEENERREREGIRVCPSCGREVYPPAFLRKAKVNIKGNIRIRCRCKCYVSFGGEVKLKEKKKRISRKQKERLRVKNERVRSSN